MPYVPRRKPAARHATTRRRAPAKAAVKSRGKPRQQPKQAAAVRRPAVAIKNGIRHNVGQPAASALVRTEAHSGDHHEERRRDHDDSQRSSDIGPRLFDVPDDNAGFPPRKFVKFNYQDELNISAAVSSIGELTYIMNGMYDPYIFTGGHQPRYFDTYFGGDGTGAPYRQFRVHGCKVQATFVNAEENDNEVIVYLHWRNSLTTTFGSVLDIGEVPNTMSALMSMGSGQPPITMEKYIKIAPMLGLDELDDSLDTVGDYTGDPLNAVYLDVGCYPAQGLETATILVKLNLTYYAECFTQNFPSVS